MSPAQRQVRLSASVKNEVKEPKVVDGAEETTKGEGWEVIWGSTDSSDIGEGRGG